MKKLTALILAMIMAFSLVACGGSEEPEKAAPEAETQAAAPEAEADGSAMVTDEDFAAIQEAYAALVELYNVVVEAYNDDQIAADENINQALSDTEALMAEMGEITQDQLTEADALDLLEAMSILVDLLTEVANQFQAA